MEERLYNAEILAPVGAADRLEAAVRCGADAVYLGMGSFNARRNAGNFDAAALAAAVSYCHGRGVKVHVTVNTLVTDSEFHLLEQDAADIAAAGVDAVIIQDLAVLRLFRDRCPGIKRHASTQMAVHNVTGAKELRDMGFDRIVLARECSLSEIEAICRESGVEAESFVHGALCMSLSGGCYLSSIIGGRSGNRGLCAQPCRLDFKANGRGYALSLKDVSYISRMKELVQAGVSSFKIEGRMKRPEYVAAAVTACRLALEGKDFDEETLKAVFSRSGFTQGYLEGKRDLSMFGVRTKQDAASSATVLGSLANLYRAERSRLPVSFSLTMDEASSTLKASCPGAEIAVSGAVPQKALNRSTDYESAHKALSKTGGTPFYLENLETDIRGEIMLPASELNALRRDALDGLLQQRSAIKPHEFLPGTKRSEKRRDKKVPALRARFESARQLPEDCGCFEKIILPLHEVAAQPELIARFGERLLAEPPSLLYPADEGETLKELEKAAKNGLSGLFAENLYVLPMGRKFGLALHGGSLLNITNTDALEEYEALGLKDAAVSFELAMAKIKHLGSALPIGAVSYGYLPLMRLRACPAKTKGGCGSCRGDTVLTDRTGAKFPLLCQRRRHSILLNSLPLYIGDRDLTGLDFTLAYFTVESAKQAQRVTQLLLAGESYEGERTAGLYYRTLQ